MILKKRKPPLALQKLGALIPRLPPTFSRLSDMKQDAAKRHKGFNGEKRVDFHIEKLRHHFVILQDISLEIHGYDFQIDSLVISDHAFYPIEIKNFNGKITFNTIFDQFTRTIDGQETGYRNPITQVESTTRLLNRWLYVRGIDNISLSPFVAISEPSTIIDVIGDAGNVAKTVGHGEHIPEKIKQIDEKLKSRLEKKIDKLKLGKSILTASKELDIDTLSKYGVRSMDVKPGVQCPQCNWLGMEREFGTWKCKRCHYKSKDAHKKAIDDYVLLIKPWMTNTDCMEFLKISSRSVATRILQSSGLVYERKKRRWIKS